AEEGKAYVKKPSQTAFHCAGISRKPAAGKGGGRFFLAGEKAKIQTLPAGRGAQIKRAALSVRLGADFKRAGRRLWHIKNGGAVKVGDDTHRSDVCHGAEELGVWPVLENVKKVAVFPP